jgi:hypothetical protein
MLHFRIISGKRKKDDKTYLPITLWVFYGVQYHLSSRTGSDQATLAVRFSAQNENLRWNKIAYFLIALKVFGKFNNGLVVLELLSKHRDNYSKELMKKVKGW